jgi:glycosyltransferase involved in cell wall biosynthesis
VKIVHVIPSLGKGGAEQVVVELANHAADEGHEVAVLTAVAAPSELLADRLRHGVRYCQIIPRQVARHWVYFHFIPWMLRNLRWLFTRDVVHCHLTFGATFGAVMQGLRWLSGRKTPAVVETYHAVGMPMAALKRGLHAAMMRSRDAVAFIADDPYWHNYRNKNPKLRAVLIPNGVRTAIDRPDPDAVSQYRRKAGLPDGAFVVGSIGRLAPERRPDRLIEVFAIVAAIHPDVHFMIAGEGSERSSLELMVAKLGLTDRVHLPGLVNDPSIALANIDVFVSSNVGPVTGVAALEAAAFGLPIVSFQMIAEREEFDGEWIWSSPSTERVAARIHNLLTDSTQRAELARQQNRHIVEKLGVDSMARAYEHLYRQAMTAKLRRTDRYSARTRRDG